MITNGEYCRKLEEEIKRLYPVCHIIACSSCTQGLQMALWALYGEFGRFSDFAPPFLYLSSFTWKSINYITRDYNRQWLDIDPETWLPTLGPLDIRPERVWPSTFLIQHTFGSVLPWEKQEPNDKVIFDAAYSLGADIKDFGDVTVFSMTATKTVTSCEGGLILTNDDDLAGEMAKLREKCGRMSEVNAAVGLAYLEHLDEIVDRKRQIFEYYRRHLPYPHQKIPISTSFGYYGMLMPFTEERNNLINKLEGKLDIRIRYQPLVRGLRNTDFVADHIICIPCFPDVPEREVVELIKEAIQ